MNYLERYRNGEYERVWDELQSLGSTVRQEPYYSLARGVATETMRRVRHNCDLIIPRLRALGHVFGAYPDGSSYYTQGARAPRVPPSEADLADIAELERITNACTGKWRDLRYSTGSVSDLSIDQ